MHLSNLNLTTVMSELMKSHLSALLAEPSTSTNPSTRSMITSISPQTQISRHHQLTWGSASLGLNALFSLDSALETISDIGLGVGQSRRDVPVIRAPILQGAARDGLDHAYTSLHVYKMRNFRSRRQGCLVKAVNCVVATLLSALPLIKSVCAKNRDLLVS